MSTNGTHIEEFYHAPHERLSFLLDHLCNALGSKDEALDLTKVRKLANQAKAVADGYDTYTVDLSSPHPPIVDKMLKAGVEHDWSQAHKDGKTKYKLIPEMSAGGYEAVVLQHFVRMSKAKTILEIGMFTGTTTVSLALLPGVTKVVALELEGYLKEINVPHFTEAGVADKIDIRIGNAVESLDQLIQEGLKFDMIFIDADKPSYHKYFDKIINSSLLAEGGTIAVDNVAYKGHPWVADDVFETSDKKGDIVHDFNQTVLAHPGVDVVMLTIEDGVSLIRRKNE